MKTNFSEYYGKRQKLDSIIESIVLEAKNNPELFEILKEAGFWGNLVNAGSQLWQGVRDGATAAYSQMTGPKTQFTNAMSSLKKALSQIQNDPQWQNSMTTGDPTKGYKSIPLTNWIQDTIKELENQHGQTANKQVGGVQTTAAQGAPGTTADPSGRKAP